MKTEALRLWCFKFCKHVRCQYTHSCVNSVVSLCFWKPRIACRGDADKLCDGHFAH